MAPFRLVALLPMLAILGLPMAWATDLAWQAPVEVARGDGERGPWQQNASRYDYVDDPTVALADDGAAFVAWVDQARKAVLLRRFAADGGALGPAVDVSRHPESFSWLPRIALAPDAPGHVYVLWQEIIFSGGSHGGDILFARSTDGGQSFSPPQNLTRRSVAGEGKGRITREVWHNGSLDLVAGPNGVVHVAWTAYEGGLWHARSDDGGARFTSPREIAGSDASPARAPALALGPDGAVYLAWTVGEDGTADIRIARSTDGGRRFGPVRIVARTPGYSDAPKLVVDDKRTLHIVFGDGNRILHARSTDAGTTFTAPQDLSGPGAGFPHVARDEASGAMHVAWERITDPRQRPLGLGMASLTYDGNTVATAAIPGSVDPGGARNGGLQGLLMRKLAANRRGDVVLVNSSFAEGAGSRVWLLRRAPSVVRAPLRRPSP